MFWEKVMRVIVLLFLIHILSLLLFAQGTRELEITNIPIDELQLTGFTLRSEKAVSIKAVGGREKVENEEYRSFMADPNNMFAFAWILNAKSRELVWRMSLNNTRSDKKSTFIRVFDDKIKLPAGEYEVYYSARIPDYTFFDDGFFSFGKLFNKLFKNKEWYEENREDWYIRIQ